MNQVGLEESEGRVQIGVNDVAMIDSGIICLLFSVHVASRAFVFHISQHLRAKRTAVFCREDGSRPYLFQGGIDSNMKRVDRNNQSFDQGTSGSAETGIRTEQTKLLSRQLERV